MGHETLRDGKWFPEFIMKDLIDIGGLSPKSLGCDVMDRSGRRFFYDKAPFAIVGWRADEYTILAFPVAFNEEHRESIIKAFVKVLSYKPFVKYEIFQNGENFLVYEWAKVDAKQKISDILAVPKTKNIEDISEAY